MLSPGHNLNKCGLPIAVIYINETKYNNIL